MSYSSLEIIEWLLPLPLFPCRDPRLLPLTPGEGTLGYLAGISVPLCTGLQFHPSDDGHDNIYTLGNGLHRYRLGVGAGEEKGRPRKMSTWGNAPTLRDSEISRLLDSGSACSLLLENLGHIQGLDPGQASWFS